MTVKLVHPQDNPFANGAAAHHYDELEAVADTLRSGSATRRKTHDPQMDDYERGYAAGKYGDASERVEHSTQAYRKGYFEGALAAVERREIAAAVIETAKRNQRRGRFLRAVAIGFAVGVLIVLGLVKCAKADTLADWNRLNEVCQGGSGQVAERACAARVPVTAKLRAGGLQGDHGVWVSPEHVAAFMGVMRQYDAIARENPGMLDSVMTGLMTDLRRAVPDEAIFALWNGRAGDLLARTPYAAALLMYGLPYLERMLSGRNDPRFVMVRMP